MNFPKVVDFRITSACPFNCSYCYGPKGIPSLTLQQIEDLFKKLKENGADSVVITGGEPLARNDFPQIISLLKELKFSISLSTTGYNFFKYNKEINHCVKHLGLPVDFSSNKKSFRDSVYFENVLKILEYYKNKKIRPFIKIGTVCTTQNLEEISDIGKLLKNYNIDQWKIYQFIPIGKNGILNKNELEIANEKFINTVKPIVEKYSEYFEVLVSERKTRASAYFMINPDGTVIVPTDNGEECADIKVGNLLTEKLNDVVKKWNLLVQYDNYKSNIQRTFEKSLLKQ